MDGFLQLGCDIQLHYLLNTIQHGKKCIIIVFGLPDSVHTCHMSQVQYATTTAHIGVNDLSAVARGGKEIISTNLVRPIMSPPGPNAA